MDVPGSVYWLSLVAVQYNINQMIQAGVQNRQAFLCLIQDINFFEFEDRKKIQQIVTDLLASSHGNNELVFTMRGSAGSAILKHLLSMYNDIDNVSFMGEYLRMFTVYPALLPCWYNLEYIKELTQVIFQPEFNIQSDAIQTLQYLLINERPAD